VHNGHTARAQNTQNLASRILHLASRARHHQIHEIVRVRQSFAVELIDGDLSVQSQRSNMFTCRLHVRRALVESVDQASVIHQERRGPLPIAAAKVNDETAVDTCCFEYVFCRFSFFA